MQSVRNIAIIDTSQLTVREHNMFFLFFTFLYCARAQSGFVPKQGRYVGKAVADDFPVETLVGSWLLKVTQVFDVRT